jgi:GT2 family glycosyltransferase
MPDGSIDLLFVGGADTPPVDWPLGAVHNTAATPAAVHEALARWLSTTRAEAIVTWDPRLGTPDRELVRRLVAGRGDVFHAGPLLGTRRQPGLMDFVAPNWMLNLDPSPDREVTSWRLSIHAAVIRTEVLRQLGLPSDDFDTLCGGIYEWGLRAIQRGALMRHVPSLVAGRTGLGAFAEENVPSLTDEVRFVAYRYSMFWARWCVMRATLTAYAGPAELTQALARIPKQRPYREPAPYRSGRVLGAPDLARARVTVLIPTLNRYKYLRFVLDNLRNQTVRPHEIIIVDQSQLDRRDTQIAQDFADLPIQILYQDEPGQCASRNAGLAVSTGDYVLFIDDDDELPPTLIEDHLRNLHTHDADVSSGVAQEVGTPPLPEDQRFTRASDVFPTNNTLVRRDVLRHSGLFDLAFNRAPRADGELGMRVYLSGAFMVLDSSNSVLHHRADEGGLRTYRVRVITYRTSRERLTHRHLPHISEIYLVSRHFSPRQKREMLWLRMFGTLSARGSWPHRLAKMMLGAALLPNTIKETRARERAAAEWLERFPQIATLER